MLYFAYGSNMDPVGMRGRCPGARAVGVARLPAHRLIFVADRPDAGLAVPSVEQSAGDEVWASCGTSARETRERSTTTKGSTSVPIEKR